MQVTEERHSVKSGFHNIRPLDYTHVKILSPGGEQAERFRNRKENFSMFKIFPGSVHDSPIFNDSPLCADLASGEYRTDFVLRDNGHPYRSYLLTPLLNPKNRIGRAYNAAHKTSRNCLDRGFGVLKRRFPCLSRGLILHYICILEKEAFFEGEDQDVDPELHIFNNENSSSSGPN
ncbi:putative nuclease HARBI1 [Zophobas morio]|uniref:putative nuclease HARBI1 n=1 Tax=Zophobas morio TaxID=2755281 RepID=UPI00308305CF